MIDENSCDKLSQTWKYYNIFLKGSIVLFTFSTMLYTISIDWYTVLLLLFVFSIICCILLFVKSYNLSKEIMSNNPDGFSLSDQDFLDEIGCHLVDQKDRSDFIFSIILAIIMLALVVSRILLEIL